MSNATPLSMWRARQYTTRQSERRNAPAALQLKDYPAPINIICSGNPPMDAVFIPNSHLSRQFFKENVNDAGGTRDRVTFSPQRLVWMRFGRKRSGKIIQRQGEVLSAKFVILFWTDEDSCKVILFTYRTAIKEPGDAEDLRRSAWRLEARIVTSANSGWKLLWTLEMDWSQRPCWAENRYNARVSSGDISTMPVRQQRNKEETGQILWWRIMRWLFSWRTDAFADGNHLTFFLKTR